MRNEIYQVENKREFSRVSDKRIVKGQGGLSRVNRARAQSRVEHEALNQILVVY
jgi:hypothetical protein